MKVGGKYRYVLEHPGQGAFAFSGEYLELVPHTKLVYTQVFEPMAEAGAVTVTISLSEKDGKTYLRSHEVYPSKEAREAAMGSGMEHGMRETMDQLDQLVGSLA